MFTADHVKPSDRAGDFFRYRPDNWAIHWIENTEHPLDRNTRPVQVTSPPGSAAQVCRYTATTTQLRCRTMMNR